MRKIKLFIRVQLKRAKRLLVRKTYKDSTLIKNVPYFSQWESPELVEDILSGTHDAKNDPNWQQSGAENLEEYAAWSASGCGMACLKMIVAHKTNKILPLVELGKRCASYGGYTLPVETSVGLAYEPFTRFVKEEFNLNAKSVLPLLFEEIIEELSKNNYVIASVSPKIRHVDSNPKARGGHLILVLGYDINKKLFYFHNPSGFKKETQEYATISFSNFKKFFGHKGIVVIV